MKTLTIAIVCVSLLLTACDSKVEPIQDPSAQKRPSTRSVALSKPGYQMQHYDLGQTNYYAFPSRTQTNVSRLKERWQFVGGDNLQAKSGDIAGDAGIEIAATDGTHLTVLDSGGKQLMQIPTDARLGILADVDSDGKMEILLHRSDDDTGIILVYDGDGTLIKQFGSDITPKKRGWPTACQPLAITDMNGDGRLELLASKGAGYSLQPRGVVVFDYSTTKELWYQSIGPFPTWICAADITGGPSREVILGSAGPANGSTGEDGTTDFSCYTFCLNGDNKSKIWRNQYEGRGFVDSSVAVSDIDSDGALDVVATSYSHGWRPWDGSSGRVYILNPDSGAIIQQHDFHRPVWMGGLADLDNDGAKEILICEKNRTASTGSLLALNHSLEIVNRFEVDGGHDINVQVITDFDGDGSNDVLVTAAGRLYVLNKELNEIWSMPLPQGTGSCFVSDLDDSGTLELIVQTGKKLYVFGIPG